LKIYLDGAYQAADSIIIKNNVIIDADADITFTSPNIAISLAVEIPVSATLIVNKGVYID
jgi:hypothetical protein